MYTHTRLYIGRQILGHYIDTPPLLFAIALHDSIICMREKEHCLKPVTIHIPQLYIIRERRMQLRISPFMGIVIKYIGKRIQITIIGAGNTPAIRKLKQMFRSQTVLQSNSRKQLEVIRCKRRVFLLCISSKIPVYMGMFQPCLLYTSDAADE